MDRTTQLAETVLIGRDSWLFQKDEGALDQLTGVIEYSTSECRMWKYTLENRTAWLQQLGVRYCFLIVPEKHVIYSDKLPPAVAISDDRPVASILRYLQSERCRASICYPVTTLTSSRAIRDTYCKLDTHWNWYGAFLASRELCSYFQIDLDAVFPQDSLEYTWIDHTGDLAVRLDPEPTGKEIVARLKRQKAAKIFENRAYSRGNVVIYENPDHSLPRAVVFRDSFGSWMFPFLAEALSRIVAVSSTEMYFELIEAEKPDIVFTQTVERYISPFGALPPPDDIRAQPFESFCNMTISDIVRTTRLARS